MGTAIQERLRERAVAFKTKHAAQVLTYWSEEAKEDEEAASLIESQQKEIETLREKANIAILDLGAMAGERDEARAKAIEECAGIADRRVAVWRGEGDAGNYPAECVASVCEKISIAIRALNGGDLREADAAIKEAGK